MRHGPPPPAARAASRCLTRYPRPVARVVVLNGTSSSGKTAVARAFQEVAPSVSLNFSIDTILYALPPSAIARIQRGDDIRDLHYPRLVRAYYACVAELARLGHDLVIDHALTSRDEAEMLLGVIAGHRALLVALDCPLEVLEERERARGDRRHGLAAVQCDRVHRWLAYDLRIDTSRVTPEDAARRIVEAMRSGGIA